MTSAPQHRGLPEAIRRVSESLGDRRPLVNQSGPSVRMTGHVLAPVHSPLTVPKTERSLEMGHHPQMVTIAIFQGWQATRSKRNLVFTRQGRNRVGHKNLKEAGIMESRSCCWWVVRLIAVVVFAGAVDQASGQSDAEKRKLQAIRDFNGAGILQNTGLYPQAAKNWEAFIQKYPQDERLPQAYYYWGICLAKNQQHEEAARQFRTVLKQFPQFERLESVQYRLGKALYDQATGSKQPEDYRLAAGELGLVASRYPKSEHADRALYLQGESSYFARETEAAITAYSKLIKDYPKTPHLADAYYGLAFAQQEQGQHQQAVATLREFLAQEQFSKHPLAPEIRLRLGLSLAALQQYVQAEPHLAAVAKEKEFALADFAYLKRGECFLELGELKKCTQIVSDLVKKFPESPYRTVAELLAGKAYFQQEEYSLAEEMLRQVTEHKGRPTDRLQPGSLEQVVVEATYLRGRCLLQLDRPQQALEILEPAAQKYRESVFAASLEFSRIAALEALARKPQSETQQQAQMRTARDLFSRFAADQALLQEKQSQNSSGGDQHQAQLVGDDLLAQALYRAAFLGLDLKDYSSTRQHADALLADSRLRQHPLRPAGLFLAAEGRLLGSQGKASSRELAQAEELYRRLVQEFPKSSYVARAHLRIGWCLNKLHKHADCVSYLQGIKDQLQNNTQVAQAQLLIGRGCLSLDRLRGAIASFQASLAADDRWRQADEATLLLAQSLQAEGQLDEAAKQLQRFLREYPSSGYLDQALYESGEIARRQKKYDQAVGHYQKVLSQFDSKISAPRAAYGLALAYYDQQDDPKAIQALTDLLTQFPQSSEAHRALFLRGVSQHRLKQFQQATADLQEFLNSQLARKSSPEETGAARYYLALSQISLGQYDQCGLTLEALLAEDPDYQHADQVYYELGHALLAHDDLRQAAKTFRTLATKLPASRYAPEAWFRVGEALESIATKAPQGDQQRTQLTQAAEAYAAGLQATADKPAARGSLREQLHYKLGEVLYRQKKFPQAAETLNKQLEIAPQGQLAGPARLLAAECLYQSGELEQSLTLFQQVAEQGDKTDRPRALYRAGDLASRLQKWPQSQQYFQKLIKEFPEYPQLAEARYGLGWSLQNQNDAKQAASEYHKVIDQTQTETAAKAKFMLGEIAFGEKDYDLAVEHFLTLVGGYPYKNWQCKARLEAARCLIELGKKEAASKQLETIVQTFSEFQEAQAAAKLLASLKKQ